MCRCHMPVSELIGLGAVFELKEGCRVLVCRSLSAEPGINMTIPEKCLCKCWVRSQPTFTFSQGACR